MIKEILQKEKTELTLQHQNLKQKKYDNDSKKQRKNQRYCLEFDSISYRKISRSIYYPRTYELCSAFKLTVSRRETVGSAV